MFPVTQTPIELDWRFAELVARSWTEPELARRYTHDPVAVLAEFGLHVADAADAPKLTSFPEPDLVVEDLHGSDADFRQVTYCVMCTKDVVRPAGGTAKAAR